MGNTMADESVNAKLVIFAEDMIKEVNVDNVADALEKRAKNNASRRLDIQNLGVHLNEVVKTVVTDATKRICKVTHILDDVRRSSKISRATINELVALAKDNLEIQSKILTAFEAVDNASRRK